MNEYQQDINQVSDKQTRLVFNNSLPQEDRDYITGFLADPLPLPQEQPEDSGRVYSVRITKRDGGLFYGHLIPVYDTLLIQDENGYWENAGPMADTSIYEMVMVTERIPFAE